MVASVGPMFYRVLNSLVDFSLYDALSLWLSFIEFFSPFLDPVQVSVLHREVLNVAVLQNVLWLATTALNAVSFLRVERTLSSFHAAMTTQAIRSMYKKKMSHAHLRRTICETC